jgi:hypothetical protein
MIVLRIFLLVAGFITALCVPRDALNFGVIETLVAIILIAALCLAVAFWSLRPPGSQGDVN